MVTTSITSMFDTFTTIRTAILKSSTISKRFLKSQFHTIEPKLKHIAKYLPFIVIKVPSVNDNERYLGCKAEDFNNNIDIILTIDYNSRDNFATYFGAIYQALYDNESDLNAIGYYIESSNSNEPVPATIHGKDIVIGTLTLTTEYNTIK